MALKSHFKTGAIGALSHAFKRHLVKHIKSQVTGNNRFRIHLKLRPKIVSCYKAFG